MRESLELLNKYSSCPKCGNEYIGNGQGGVIVDENSFTRWCKCGYEIVIKQEDLQNEGNNF